MSKQKDTAKPKKTTIVQKRKKSNRIQPKPTKKKVTKKGTGTAVPFPFNLLNF